ncbi:hypothetical protein Salat_0076400 [Sesamum alatum]|uniref:Uncharacterized protein n=1 Tax=Sesamum alatum TaxID=300844 RepID=A0AAE1YVN5_9LAMI|nr:hypothetical protein Salat_0076400 [Sesamum alatum]
MGDRRSSAPEESNNSKTTQASHSHVVADEEREEAFPFEVSITIQSAETTSMGQQKIHKVPSPLRVNKEHLYVPVAVSLGPYHHGRSQFPQVEDFKVKILNSFIADSGSEDKAFLYSKILERVDEIRSHYEEGSTDEFNDESFAEMILLDACFIIFFMKYRGEENVDKLYDFQHLLGWLGYRFAIVDLFMLENQIPLWVIKLLNGLMYHDKDDGEALLSNYLSKSLNIEYDYVLQEITLNEPLHLLEARRQVLLGDPPNIDSKAAGCLAEIHKLIKGTWRRKRPESRFKQLSHPFRSVTDLKAKGIRFSVSSHFLLDIRFHSYCFYGLLQLPALFVNDTTKVFFSNAIAFEMSPETDSDLALTSYVYFMKSLIENPKDVKELREKGILFSRLGSDEEVVNMFKEIDTYGLSSRYIFPDVKLRIEKHCNSKAKTWMAELIHTYFRSPWTAIALFAAAILLCLTFLQTFYTIHPAN